MAKKLSGGANLLDSVLNKTQSQELSQTPIQTSQNETKKSPRGRKPKTEEERTWGEGKNYDRATNIVNVELYSKLKEIAHRESLTLKDVLEAAMKKAVENYESKNGTITLTRTENDIDSLF